MTTRAEDLADTWGHIRGRAFAAAEGRPAERADAVAALFVPLQNVTLRAEMDAPCAVVEIFVRAFCERCAAELAAEQAGSDAARAEESARAGLETAIAGILRAGRTGSALARQEAARTALRQAIRYGLPSSAQGAARFLCQVQQELDAVQANFMVGQRARVRGTAQAGKAGTIAAAEGGLLRVELDGGGHWWVGLDEVRPEPASRRTDSV